MRHAARRALGAMAGACGLIAGLLAVTGSAAGQVAGPVTAVVEREAEVGIETAFGKECEAVVVNAIQEARTEILVAMYSLTNPRIVEALARASTRGVRVSLKYDARQARYEPMAKAVANLKKRRVRCQAITIEPAYAAMHHKFMVIDRRRVVTGSFNFTSAAASVSDENLVLIESPRVAAPFIAEFESIKSRSP